MGLLSIRSATHNVLFATIIFLTGGILGTFHHLYFTGTPTGVMALGATFSALEVVPLVLIGFEAYHNYRLSKATEWLERLQVAHILPTPCFFGTSWAPASSASSSTRPSPSGDAGAGTLRRCMDTRPSGLWHAGHRSDPLRTAQHVSQAAMEQQVDQPPFWSLNIGLLLMVLLSLLPVGLMQTVASVKEGCGTPAQPSSCRSRWSTPSSGCAPSVTPSSRWVR